GFLCERNAADFAKKLAELCEEPEKMKTVGQNAMDKIYISWEESIKKAVERYKIVLENYRAGKYERKQTFADEWLSAEGEILDAMCKVKKRGKRIKNEFKTYGKTAYKNSVKAAKSFNRRRIKIKNLAKSKGMKIRKTLLKKIDRYF
ncbi:MAG: hypothetical protein IJZ58_06695, partial [Oscillospiraceae bacterium]|nr:hypothetical protein [Oscillospiraceae bacterium]